MSKRIRILTGATTVIIIVGLIALIFSAPEAPLAPALPNPNGYEDFKEAGKLARSSGGSVSEMTEAELESFVAANTQSIELAKRGLKKDSAVPVTFSQEMISAHLQDLSGLKKLSSVLNAEARLIGASNAVAGALANVDSIRYAHGVGRGGLIIDHLLGLACQHIPARKLGELRNQLDAAQAREVFDGIYEIYQKRQPAHDVLAREDQWIRIAGDWRTRVAILIRPGLVKPAHQKYVERVKAGDDEMRALLIDYAGRIEAIDQSRMHEDLKEIVSALQAAQALERSTNSSRNL